MSEVTTLEVSCPDCHAKKGAWCVYIQPNTPTGTKAWREQAARAGQFTKRPHNGRMQKAYWIDRDRKRKAREADYTARNAASPERAAILRANAEAVAEEQRGLITWLSQHAGILL